MSLSFVEQQDVVRIISIVARHPADRQGEMVFQVVQELERLGRTIPKAKEPDDG